VTFGERNAALFAVLAKSVNRRKWRRREISRKSGYFCQGAGLGLGGMIYARFVVQKP
jgi:hypothetical protein